MNLDKIQRGAVPAPRYLKAFNIDYSTVRPLIDRQNGLARPGISNLHILTMDIRQSSGAGITVYDDCLL